MIRRMTGIGIGLVSLALWLLGGWFVRVALMALGTLSVWEMYTALEHTGSRPVRWVGVAYAALQAPVYHLCGGLLGLLGWTLICAMVGLCVPMLRGDTRSDSLLTTVFPILYPGLFFGMMIPPSYIQPRSLAMIVFGMIYGCAMLNDVFAYEIGTLYGKTPLAPKLSPKKTVEGSVAGIAASVVTALVVMGCVRGLFWLFPMEDYVAAPMWLCLLYALAAGAVDQLGDLCASMVKRHCGVKDYGTIFPGHGGAMDRLDGILFGAALALLFFGQYY